MVNKVILIGNVGKDPEIRNLDNGNTVANFSLATSETYKDKNGEKQTDTEWHNVTIWGKLAEVVSKYVTKGKKVYLEGKIKTRSYEKDGETKYVTDIICNNMQILSSKNDTETTSVPKSTPDPDDLPF
jgi:single-strand DNA-binding protein